MNEKILLNKPNGEQTEVNVIAHFKVTSEGRVNVKNTPILITTTKKMDNGNEVLEFYIEKSGLYQPIKDEQAWTETKSVIIEIITGKNAQVGVEPLKISKIETVAVNATLESGRPLAIKPEQVITLQNNAKNMMAMQTEQNVVTETPNVVQDAVPVVETPSTTPEVTPQEIQEPQIATPVADLSTQASEQPVQNPMPSMPVNTQAPVENIPASAPVFDMPVMDNTVQNEMVSPVMNEVNPVLPGAETISPEMNPQVIETPVVAPTEEVAPPVMDFAENQNIAPASPEVTPAVDTPVMDFSVPESAPVEESIPAMDTPVISPEPSMDVSPITDNHVEIVSSEKKTVFDSLSKRIIELEELRTKEIAEVNQKYTELINQTIMECQNEIKSKETEAIENLASAKETLKEAEARNTIANVAFDNAMNIQNNTPQEAQVNYSPGVEQQAPEGPVLSLTPPEAPTNFQQAA